jgi:hypothetical protein
MATRKATTTKRRSTAKGTKTSSRAKSSGKGTKTTRRKSTAAKRTLIEPTKGDKRYVRRDKGGKFKEMDDVGRSLSMDRRRKAKTKAKKGQGDRGD